MPTAFQFVRKDTNEPEPFPVIDDQLCTESTMSSSRMSLSAYARMVGASSWMEAARAAAANGRKLGKYGDPTEPAREDIDPDDASIIALDDPSLVYVEEVGF